MLLQVAPWMLNRAFDPARVQNGAEADAEVGRAAPHGEPDHEPPARSHRRVPPRWRAQSKEEQSLEGEHTRIKTITYRTGDRMGRSSILCCIAPVCATQLADVPADLSCSSPLRSGCMVCRSLSRVPFRIVFGYLAHCTGSGDKSP